MREATFRGWNSSASGPQSPLSDRAVPVLTRLLAENEPATGLPFICQNRGWLQVPFPGFSGPWMQ